MCSVTSRAQGCAGRCEAGVSCLSAEERVWHCILHQQGKQTLTRHCRTQALPYKAQLAGLGLDSTELGWPRSLFKAAF